MPRVLAGGLAALAATAVTLTAPPVRTAAGAAHLPGTPAPTTVPPPRPPTAQVPYPPPSAPRPMRARVRHACDTSAVRIRPVCLAIVRTDVPPRRGVQRLTPAGLGPADLRQAYSLPSRPTSGGRLVAITDVYDNPRAEADLAVYRRQYGLPPCTSTNGCFRKVNQNGGTTLPAPDVGWGKEEALDLDMVSAICPDCRILLVEASTESMDDLGAAVNTAVRLGARYVSNSWGGDEGTDATRYDTAYFHHPGIALTAASGDGGFGPLYPATSRYVTAVGGTTLRRAGGTRGWQETAWDGSGSGCSAYIAKPSWQKDTGCPRRTSADVAAVADPATGVAVYDTYGAGGWLVVGGTSAAAPIVAAVYALAGTPPAGSLPGSFPYARPSGLYDVVAGRNGICGPAYLCTAGPGYDGPTGLGSPHGVTAFQAPAAARRSPGPTPPASAPVTRPLGPPAGSPVMPPVTVPIPPPVTTAPVTTAPIPVTVTRTRPGRAGTTPITGPVPLRRPLSGRPSSARRPARRAEGGAPPR